MNIRQIEIEKDLFEVSFAPSEIIIDEKEIQKSLGYVDVDMPDYFKDIISEASTESRNKISIKSGYKLLNVEFREDSRDGFFIDGLFFKTEKIVRSQLKDSEQVALFANTIGQEMEDWSKQLIDNGDPVYGFIVDSVASVIVESITDKLHDHIGMQMQNAGLKITNRYSPGYCNWSVFEQHKLFSKFPEKFCDVTLTQSALMIPKKSITGIVGVGANVKYRNYICDVCGMKDCTYRSKRTYKLKYTK